MKARLVVRKGIALLLVPFSLLLAAGPQALDDAEVRAMEEKCEAARTIKLTPIREQRTQACIEQQLRSPGHCERYYSTYGNVSAGPGNFMHAGYFYDLPECVEWIEAREKLRLSRSRP